MKHFIAALEQYADFSGRATRTQFWMYYLFNVLFYLVAALADSVSSTQFMTLIYSLGMLVPILSIGARRLHDVGRKGGWQLLLIFPLLGTIFLAIFWVQKSKGDNRYSPKPAL